MILIVCVSFEFKLSDRNVCLTNCLTNCLQVEACGRAVERCFTYCSVALLGFRPPPFLYHYVMANQITINIFCIVVVNASFLAMQRCEHQPQMMKAGAYSEPATECQAMRAQHSCTHLPQKCLWYDTLNKTVQLHCIFISECSMVSTRAAKWEGYV